MCDVSAELLGRAQGGSASALGDLLESLRPEFEEIIRQSRVHANNLEDAQQQAAIEAMRCVRTYQPEKGPFRAYVFGTVQKMARRFRLRTGRRLEFMPLEDIVEPAGADPASDVEEMVCQAPHAEIVRQYFGLGCRPRSVNQIAAATGRSWKRVKQDLGEALESMRKAAS